MKRAILFSLITIVLLAGVAATSLTHLNSPNNNTNSTTATPECGAAGDACMIVTTGNQRVDTCCDGLQCENGVCVKKPSFFGKLIRIFRGTPQSTNEPGKPNEEPNKPVNNPLKPLRPTLRPKSECCAVTVCLNEYAQEFICQDGAKCAREYRGCRVITCEPPKPECPACEPGCEEKVQTCKVRDTSTTTHVAYKTVKCEGTLEECQKKYGDCECGWEEPGCTYNGQEYENGEQFPAGDGCNECVCKGGTVRCTEKACSECKDECQTCKVRDTSIATHVAYKSVKCCGPLEECQKKYGECECGWEEPGCTYNGKTYEKGDSFPADDGCNTCACSENGQVFCTKMVCRTGCNADVQTCKVQDPSVTTHVAYKSVKCEGSLEECQKKYGECECGWEAPACTYNGQTYEKGDSFPADDGCNECSCSENGKVVCTTKACKQECTAEVQTCKVIDPSVTTHVAYKNVQCEGSLEECQKKYGECECGNTLTVNNNLQLTNTPTLTTAQ